MQEKNKLSRFFASRFADPVICVLLFVFSFLIAHRLSLYNFDPHHTGLMYKIALDVANGKVLFLETFTQYGSLTSYIQALFVLLFGESVSSILLSTVIFYAASFVMLYLVARRFLGKLASAAAVVATVFLAAFYMWEFHPWSSVFALFFMLVSVYALQSATQKRGAAALVWAGVSGLFAALTFWCRQPVGVVSVLAGALCLVFLLIVSRKSPEQKRAHIRNLLSFGVGAVVGVVALLIPILATGAGQDFVTQSLSGMVGFASARSGTDRYGIFGFVGMLLYNLFLSPFAFRQTHLLLDMIWFFLPASALFMALLTAVRMIRASRREGAGFTPGAGQTLVLIYAVYAVAEWHQYYPVLCLRHWFWGAFLCAPAVFLVVRELLSFLPRFRPFAFLREARWRVLAAVLIPLIFFTPNAVYRIRKGAARVVETVSFGKYENPYYTHLNGMYLSPQLAGYYDGLFETMHTLQEAFPDTNVVNTTENGIYAVFGENFCPMFNNSGDAYYKDYPERLKAYIDEARPIVIGAEAPDESYVLYREMSGFDGDYGAGWHRLPANIYLPAELFAKLP